MPDEIDEILKFDPGIPKARDQQETDEIEEILKFDPMRNQEPVGGTFEKQTTAFPGGGPPQTNIATGQLEQSEQQFGGTYIEPSAENASFAAMAEAGIVDDPVTKVKIFAKHRRIPVSEISKRYRIRNGEIEFKADNGKWQREVSSRLASKIKQAGAQIATHPSTYLGTAGALVAGAPGAVGGSMLGEGIRKTVGKTVYDEPQTVGGNIVDIALEGAFALGGEMVAKLIKGSANKYLARKAKALKYAGSEISSNLLSPEDHARALWVKNLASQHGITLAPHQLYDKEGMTNIWKYLRKHPLTANSVQKFEKTLEGQSEEAIDGFIKQMGGYKEGRSEIGAKLRTEAKGAIKTAEEAREAASKPYYEKAFDQTPTPDLERLAQESQLNKQTVGKLSEFSRMQDTTRMANELKQRAEMPSVYSKVKGEDDASFAARIAKDYEKIFKRPPLMAEDLGVVSRISELESRNKEITNVLKGGKPAEGVYVPTVSKTVDISTAAAEVDRLLNSTVPGDPSHTALRRIQMMLKAAGGDPRKLDRVKRSGIDNVLNKTGTSKTMSRELKLVKDKLTAAMDKQIPDYATARAKYAELSKPIDKLKESVIGQLADLNDDKLTQATRKLFSVTNMPDHVILKNAREIIQGRDPDLWRRAVGGFIRDVYEDLMVTEEGKVANTVGKLHKRLYGSKHQRQIMAEAFGGANTPEYKNFESLMEVFKRAAIGASKESMTMPFSQIQKELAGSAGSQVYDFLSTPKQYVVDKAFGWWNDALLRGRQDELLKALTAPDVQARIAKLKQLTPNSRKFIETFSVMTALVAGKIEPGRLPERAQGQIAPQQMTAPAQP